MKKDIVGLKDLRDNMETYIKQVEKGKSFTVVRRSKPVFRISPANKQDAAQTEELVEWTDHFIDRYRGALEKLAKQ